VLLADAAGAGRRAIAALLRSLPGIALVSEAGSLEELARERRTAAPDVIVIDDRLLGAASLGPRDADVPLVVMGLDDDPSFARRARRIGATAWIAKEHADELLPGALDDARRRRDAARPTA
jgi:DNA-binding NarL/FixJ family response regulator